MGSRIDIETLADDIYNMLESLTPAGIKSVLDAAKNAFDLQYPEIFNSWLGDLPGGNNEQKSIVRFRKVMKTYLNSREEAFLAIEAILKKAEGGTKKSSLKGYILRCLVLLVTPEEDVVPPKKTNFQIIARAASAVERDELSDLRALLDSQRKLDLVALRKAVCKKISEFDEDELMKKAAHHIAEKICDVKSNTKKVKQAVKKGIEEYESVATLSFIKSWFKSPFLGEWYIDNVIKKLTELLESAMGKENPTSLKGLVLKHLAFEFLTLEEDKEEIIDPANLPMSLDEKKKFLLDIKSGKVDLTVFLGMLCEKIELKMRCVFIGSTQTEDDSNLLKKGKR